MIAEIKLNQIVVEDQPRKMFDELKMVRLRKSIERHGIKQPLVVSETAESGKYLLVDGERRFRAAKELKLDTVPVSVEKQMDKLSHTILQFHIQEQHEGWNALEKAVAIHDLSEEIGKTTREVGEMLGLDKEEVGRYVSFSNLVSREKFEKSDLPVSWARSINQVKTLAKFIYRKKLGKEFLRSEERALEEAIMKGIKIGFIVNQADIRKIKDAFSSNPASIEKFSSEVTDPSILMRESNADGFKAKRQLVTACANFHTYVKNILESNNVEITPADKSSMKSAIRSLKTLLGE